MGDRYAGIVVPPDPLWKSYHGKKFGVNVTVYSKNKRYFSIKSRVDQSSDASAGNLISGDTNGTGDVFLIDRGQ